MPLHQERSVSPSVHLLTIQKVSQSVHKFNSLPDSQSTIQTVSLSIINQATQLINQTLFHQWINHSNSYSTVQKKVDSPLRVLILDEIHNSRFLNKSRIKNQEQAIENRVEDQPMTDFSIILQRHTAVTQHSMVKFTQATVCSEKDQFKQ